MVRRNYAKLDQCRICKKVYKNGPAALYKHIQEVHRKYDIKAIHAAMTTIPNPDYIPPPEAQAILRLEGKL